MRIMVILRVRRIPYTNELDGKISKELLMAYIGIPGSYHDFGWVMVIYPFCQKTRRILLNPFFNKRHIYIHIYIYII